MKVHYECLSCFITQSQKISELATEDLEKRKEAMIVAAKAVQNTTTEMPFPQSGGACYFWNFIGCWKMMIPLRNIEDFKQAGKKSCGGAQKRA